MKKYILLILLSTYYVLAMNNNDPRPVRFDSPLVLYGRLRTHDEKYNTSYATLAEKYKLHISLGNTIRLRSEVCIVIIRCLKDHDPNMTESQMLEHKRNIINALNPKLSESAKL